MNRIRRLLLREKLANLKHTIELRKQTVAALRERVTIEKALKAINE